MKINLKELKNLRECTRYLAIVENEQGKQESFHGTYKAVNNEFIRLVYGHNWKVVQYPHKELGILDAEGYFYPYTNQHNARSNYSGEV